MTIYLIRHAQSMFNAVFEQGDADPMIFDSPLSKLGEQQARETQNLVQQLDISSVIVSPLTRTLQTATLLFGKSQPYVVNALVREQVLHSCDVGRPRQELAQDFPHFDFTRLDEIWWHDEQRNECGVSVEPHEVLQQRADSFARYLKDNAIHSTAIVSHGNFIRALTGIKPENCQIIEFDPQ